MNPLFPPGKFEIPHARPRGLERTRLLDILAKGAHRPLALILAPAGFGKTTLAADWARRSGTPAAWFGVEEEDGDPARFAAGLRAAVENALPGTGALDAGGAESAEQSVMALLAALVVSGASLLLVLDDAHLMTGEPVWRILGRMVEHLPANVRMILATREEPGLPLARMRARDQVTDIATADLQFTAEEGARFLSDVMGLRLAPDSVALLEAQTEGWAAGLQLAALTLRGAESADRVCAGLSGRSHLLEDYLVGEVLSRQPAAVRDFLLRTAFLRRLTPSLCETLTRTAPDMLPARDMLEKLESTGLFTQAVDDRREWYRYHPLFADLLRARLEREHADWIPGLHRAAAGWHEAAGGFEEAIHHALAIPDPALAARLMERCGSALLNDGRISTLLGWLGRLPDEIITASPSLCTGAGWSYVLAGDAERAERYANMASAQLTEYRPAAVTDGDTLITAAEVTSDLESILAYAARLRGDEQGMREHTRRAIAARPEEAGESRFVLELNLGLMEFQCGNLDAAYRTLSGLERSAQVDRVSRYAMASAICLQGEIRLLQGRLAEAVDHYRRVEDRLRQDPAGGVPARTECMRRIGLARIAYERNELPEAEEELRAAREAARRGGDQDGIATADFLSAWCALAEGDLTRAEGVLAASTRRNEPDSEREGDALRSTLMIAKGDLRAAAEVWANPKAAESIPNGRFPLEMLGHARIKLARHEFAGVLSILQSGEGGVQASWPASRIIAAAALRAAAHLRLRNPLQAMEAFAEALCLAAPGRIIQPFRIGDSAVWELLQLSLAQGIQTEFVQRVMESIRPPDSVPAGPALTGRELQILRLLAAGKTSTQVAAELVIAVNTVRTYIKEIHRKLDVHSREEALAAARRLKLL